MVVAGGVVAVATSRTEPPATEDADKAAKMPFGVGLDRLNRGLDNASGDPCKLFSDGWNPDIADPANDQQLKQAGAFIARLMNDVADALPPEHSVDANLIREGAGLISSELAAIDYDPARYRKALSVFDTTNKYAEAFAAANIQIEKDCPRRF